jgi:hypothetical protein
MDTRAVTPPASTGAPTPETEPSAPAPAESSAAASPPVPETWTGDDALSEFPTESDVRRTVRPRAGRRARRTRAWPIVAGVVAVALLALAAWRWWPGPSAARAQTGTLALETTPPGASVAIDGRERGTTPLTLPLPAGIHRIALSGPSGRREVNVNITAGGQIVHHVELAGPVATTGRLQVSGSPGTPIVLDGTPRGVSPAELTDVPAGEHTVVIGEGAAAMTQRVSVPAGGVASLVVPAGLPAGQSPAWISVAAPIDLQVFDGQILIGTSSTNRILVLAGRHTFNFVNAELGYQSTRTIQVDPGRVTALRIEVPNGMLNVNAAPWAEVFVDGRRVGETPIANLAVPIGAHEVTLRNPKFAEQKRSVVISLTGPTRLGVDLRQ